MRQFRGPWALVVVLVAAVLVAVTLLATRTQTPAPVVVSPTPVATRSPTASPRAPTASPTPTPSTTPSPVPTPAPTPPRAFLEPLRVDGVALPKTLTTAFSLAAPGTARFTITLAYTDPSAPAHAVPAFTVQPFAESHMPDASGELEISIPNAGDATTTAAPVDVGSVRGIAVGSAGQVPAKVYRLGLDDHPLWRALVLFDPTRIVIDVGAPSVSADGNTAVYQPTPSAEVARTFHLGGAARAFEATYLWRVRDTNGTVVAGAPGVASIGTSALWGAFDVDVTLPATVSGNATLEVYQVSPKDGSEVSQATVPLRVRP
jgi:immunoglobulin-like protein involved in spore germination